MQYVIFIILVIHPLLVSSQLKTPLDSLLIQIDSLTSTNLSLHLDEIKDRNKFNYLNYFPSLGYDFVSNRPLLTYNISEVASALNDRQRKKHEIILINKSSTSDLENLSKNVKIRYYRLNDLFRSYNIEIEIYNLNRELYIFDLKRYKNNEITMEQFFQSEISIREKQKSILSLKDQIYINIIELQTLTNYSLNYEIQNFNTINDSTLIH